jgi:hypothetical protein
MDRRTAMSVLLTMSAGLLLLVPHHVTAVYNIGVGIADVTGPCAGVGFVSTPVSWCSVVYVLEPR